MQKRIGAIILTLALSTACAQYDYPSSQNRSTPNLNVDSYSQVQECANPSLDTQNQDNEMNRLENQKEFNTSELQQQDKGALSSDCSHLSDEEQMFARQLSDMHRTLFCRHFSVSQRLEAMTLVTYQAKLGVENVITPDEAVETIMRNARQGNGNETDSRQTPQDSTNAQPPAPYSGGGSSNGTIFRD